MLSRKPRRILIISFAITICALFNFLSNVAFAGNTASPRHDQQREDRVFGTTTEGIRMDTDPQTGDRYIRVQPAPKEEQPNKTVMPVIISPEISVTKDGKIKE